MASKSKQVQDSSSVLQSLRERLRDKYGDDSVRVHTEAPKIGTVSTGIISLDKALGGGVPLGRMVELLGNSGSGKTTIILSTMAQAQKAFPDKSVVFIDAEHALDVNWGVKMGIDLKRFEHVQPEFAEGALDILEQFADSGEVSIIGLDSVPALLPQVEMEGDIGDANIGIQARLMAQAMRRIGRIMAKHKDLCVMFINQKRAQLQSRGGFQGHEQTKATGGMAMPFYMSTRLEVYRLAAIKDGDVEIGQETGVNVKKHKVLTGPGARASFSVNKFVGIDTAKELLDIGEQHGKVIKKGSWYSLPDTDLKWQGEEGIKEWIRKNMDSIREEWLREPDLSGTD